uniref:E3 ubiquitin-protein ligase TRIM7-like n=1 Tax=Euleptes europaea TaxID=460621 RepID=UPI0025417ED2|nr:E3 ubiquitin-protein ligase TRIM7-like [Euleptes europaea]
MAAGGPLLELREEASCSVCLDFFRDPVMIPECGHSFCRDCLTRSWGAPGDKASCCPQCRGRAQEGTLQQNRQLANLVGIAQKFTLQEGKEAGEKGARGKGGICEKHQEPLRFFCKEDQAPLCGVCSRSEEHQDHQVVPLEEAAQEKRALVAARKGRICQKYQEPLNLFCKNDEALICVACDRSEEHRDHETLPLEEASQEYKDQFCNRLEMLKKERERIVASKADVVKESQDLLISKQTKQVQQETETKFRQLHKFLEEQEKLLLAQMEEVEKEVARNRDQHLAKISETLSSLESLIQEMEEKCQQLASELLQDARNTLQRYEEKEEFEDPVAFPLAQKWCIWDLSDLNLFLESIKKQFEDTLDSGFHLQKACVTLDPDTAHPGLLLSEDWKSVRDGEKAQALPDWKSMRWGGKAQSLPSNPERFSTYTAVLGREGFTAGRHFWEVLVGSEERWAVGVARESVRRKGRITFGPERGIWAVGKWCGHYRASIKGQYHPLSLTREPKRIRVCLNYAGGRVAFFDADRGSLIHEFSGASFSGETLLPFFWVNSEAHLKLSSS